MDELAIVHPVIVLVPFLSEELWLETAIDLTALSKLSCVLVGVG